MTDKIIDSIAEKLNKIYPDYDIYTEDVEQGLTTPCFFILPISVSDIRHIGRRWEAKYSVIVQYLPESDSPKAECVAVEETLYKILELVTVDGNNIRSSNISSETTDDVLNFSVTYRMFTLEEPSDDMEFMTELMEGEIDVRKDN